MADGNVPMRSLVWQNGTIYGVTAFGGSGAGNGNGTVWSYDVMSIPEPTSFAMFGIALVGMARRRRQR